MGRKKKVHHEEHPDERWLITYADVLTLMFVLFMVLFSISVVNTGKFEQLKESLSKALSNGALDGGPSVLEQGPEQVSSPVVQTPPGAIDPQIPGPTGFTMATGSNSQQSLETAQLEQAQKNIEEGVKQAGLGDQVKTVVDERGLAIRLKTEPFLFTPGSAAINPEARRLLRPIARSVAALGNPVRVEGHTDSTPIRTAQFPSNWWLGAGRACAVLEVLGTDGVPGSRLSCSSYGDTKPEGDNDSAAGRSLNRRVEILVLRLQGEPGQPSLTATGG